MNKQEKIKNFDPNSVGDLNNSIFGLPFNADESEIILVPVPWEVTVSYGGGTLEGPEAIRNASYQVDLFDPNMNNAWMLGIWMDEVNPYLKSKSAILREKAENYIENLTQGIDPEMDESMIKTREEILQGCKEMNAWVEERCKHFLSQGKIVGLIGGDHSTPLGFTHALLSQHDSFAVLQIDAHADLRDSYEGFEFSHASIMFNVLKKQGISKLVQVGIRDYCEEEYRRIQESQGRIITFFDREIKHSQYCGESWSSICDRIIHSLPEKVYISFDIDGLDPKLCPNTGTPVAGGFEAEQVLFLIEKIVKSGKKIIGFDINEVAPGEDDFDANVAARILYRLSNLVALSNGKKPND